MTDTSKPGDKAVKGDETRPPDTIFYLVKRDFEWADEFYILRGTAGMTVGSAGMHKMHKELGEDSPLEEITGEALAPYPEQHPGKR